MYRSQLALLHKKQGADPTVRLHMPPLGRAVSVEWLRSMVATPAQKKLQAPLGAAFYMV